MANISDLTLMPFIGLHTFKVKLFFENSLLSNILSHLKTKITPSILTFFAV